MEDEYGTYISELMGQYSAEMITYQAKKEEIASRLKKLQNDYSLVSLKLKGIKNFISQADKALEYLNAITIDLNKEYSYLDKIIMMGKKYEIDRFDQTINSSKTIKKRITALRTSANSLLKKLENEETMLSHKIMAIKDDLEMVESQYISAKSSYDYYNDEYRNLTNSSKTISDNTVISVTPKIAPSEDILPIPEKSYSTASVTPTPPSTSSQTVSNSSSYSSTPVIKPLSSTSTTKGTSKGGGCFLKGTKVLIDMGLKDIDKIEVNDRVITYNEETKESEIKKVLRVLIHENLEEDLYTLEFDNYKLDVTGSHRFYIEGKWVSASMLKVGDKLQYYNGEKHIVEKITNKKKISNYYNLEIEDNHNYYVSEKEVLVHNRKMIA